MTPKNRWLTVFGVLLIWALLSACAASPVAPMTTPLPPTAASIPSTHTPVSPTPVAATPTPMAPTSSDRVEVRSGVITSQALAGNLLGDPVTRQFNVLLPPNYAASDKRYPVVYMLHGYGGGARTHVADFFLSYQAALNKDAVQEMIFVFPDGNNKLGGSFYANSPTIGDYETYITREIVDEVDATYRTLRDRTSRGITGCSMGGDGALYLALKYPDVFSVAAPSSAGYDSSSSEAGDWLVEQATEYLNDPPQDLAEFNALPWERRVFVAAVAAYAPDPDNPPFYLDLPVKIVNGQVQPVPEILDKLSAQDVVDELDPYLARPERLSAILIYHGKSDQLTPVEAARAFDQVLTDRGIEHDYLEVDGGHCDFGSQGYLPVIQFMSDHLVGE